ncbi:sensor histidine kinase [Deinococcus sp.]|uniref:sensor histidine kinase n=1 Tax=Deinococcus sp. TaxID=47478 RepID=UPI003C7BCAE5
MNVRARLTLSVALTTLVVVVVVAAVQFLALRSFLTLAEKERLEMLVPPLQTSLSAQLGAGGPAPLDLSALPRNVDVRVLQGGRVLAQSPEFPRLALTEPAGYRPLAGHNVLITGFRLLGRPATAQLASDLIGTIDPPRAYLRALAITAPLAAVVVALLSFTLAGRMLRPLARLEETAADVGRHGNLRIQLPGADRRDELGRLAQTLQTTFSQLAAVREREEEFTRSAAHDLRSPLAALKTRLQGALSGPRSDRELREEITEALADVERMRQLTEHLLLLARGEKTLELAPTDLARLVGEVVDRARERSPDVQLYFETRGDTALHGDQMLLTQLADNLISNGLKHAGGADIQVSVIGEQREISLSVCDSGAGVPEESLPRLVEPFYRADRARGGAGNGLGLAIVCRVAELHGAALRMENRRPNGLAVTILFRRPPAQLSDRQLS